MSEQLLLLLLLSATECRYEFHGSLIITNRERKREEIWLMIWWKFIHCSHHEPTNYEKDSHGRRVFCGLSFDTIKKIIFQFNDTRKLSISLLYSTHCLFPYLLLSLSLSFTAHDNDESASRYNFFLKTHFAI